MYRIARIHGGRMSDEKFDRSKTHESIGTIGHIDESKTALITSILQTMRMSKPQVQQIPREEIMHDTNYEDHPNFKNKGKRGLRCNRTACEHTEAYYWNRVTNAYYCQPCAHGINEASMHDMDGREPLLSLSYEDKEAWAKAKQDERRNGLNADHVIVDDPLMHPRKGKSKLMNNLTAISTLAMMGGYTPSRVKVRKGHEFVFTESEKQYLNTLGRKDKKKAVKLLKEKYELLSQE